MSWKIKGDDLIKIKLEVRVEKNSAVRDILAGGIKLTPKFLKSEKWKEIIEYELIELSKKMVKRIADNIESVEVFELIEDD